MTDRRAHNDAQRWTPDGVAKAAAQAAGATPKGKTVVKKKGGKK